MILICNMKKDTVTKNMNIRDPRYPPKIIVIGDLVNKGLYICIPENISKVKMDDKTKDVALFTAEKKHNSYNLIQYNSRNRLSFILTHFTIFLWKNK